MSTLFIQKVTLILDRTAEVISAPIEHVRRRFGEPLTAVVVGCMVAVGAFLLYSPPPTLWLYPPVRLEDFAKLCAWPLARNLSSIHVGYRITTPVIAWLLGLRGSQGVILQYLGNIAAFSIIYVALRRRTDSRIAFLSTAALGTTMVAHVSNEWMGYPDSVTNLCVALSMLSPHPLALGAMAVFGALNDEKFLLSVPFILVWHLAGGSFTDSVRRSIRMLGGLTCGFVVVLAVRLSLERGIIGPGLPATGIGGGVGGSPWSYVLLGAFFGLRWLWVIPVLTLVLLRHTKSYWAAIATAAFLVLGCCGLRVKINLDFSRSAAALFPAVLVGVKLLFDNYKWATARIIVPVFLACLLTPQLNIIGDTWIEWIRPLPLSLIRVNYHRKHPPNRPVALPDKAR